MRQGATVIALFAYDADGRRTSMTTSSGTVVATYEYDAFGNHLATIGSVVNLYRYAGYRLDTETGLYYLNARYYLPSVGRLITRDAFHGFEDDPASLNQYNYAHSNPVRFVDPSGYSAIASGNGVILGISALVFVPGIGQVSLLGIAAAVGGAWLISKYGLPWAIERYHAQNNKQIRKRINSLEERIKEHEEKIRANPVILQIKPALLLQIKPTLETVRLCKTCKFFWVMWKLFCTLSRCSRLRKKERADNFF